MDKLLLPSKNVFLPLSYTLPARLVPWVMCQTSLTERLRSHAHEVRLQIIEQGFGPPNIWDKNVLQMKNVAVFHRDIVLWAGDEACWYARTIIPDTSYQAQDAFFNRLQKEPLGALIFDNPHVVRIHRVDYPIDKRSLEYHWVMNVMAVNAELPTMLWTRLSVYTYDEVPFYLVEIFLPAVEKYA